MLTQKEQILLQWLFGTDRCTTLLNTHDIRELDVLIDPDTTADSEYVGIIPHFWTGPDILKEVMTMAADLAKKANWGGVTTHLFYLPLIAYDNPLVKQFWDYDPRLMGSCSMIKQDHLDRLISDRDLVKSYLTNVPADPMGIEGYDRQFAADHRLPVYVLYMDPFDKIRDARWPDMANVMEFYFDIVLAMLMYHLPSTLRGNKPAVFTYTPRDPNVLDVSDFTLNAPKAV